MIRFALTIVLLFFLWHTAISQSITLDQVMSLRTKSLAQVEEFLTSRGWQFLEASEPTDGTMGIATFAYDKSVYNDRALAFIKYMYSGSSDTKRISVQLNKQSVYNLFLGRVKALKFQLEGSKVVNGSIRKIYRLGALMLLVDIDTIKETYATSTAYTFLLCKMSDYLINFAG